MCDLCPRQCNTDRSKTAGYCGAADTVTISRAALHYWEEPCLGGEEGSGAVFFSGCPLHCVYCQNSDISRGGVGKAVTVPRLREIFRRLISEGANNIDLVTPTHFVPQIVEALDGGLPVPVVYNCGGYERVETLKKLSGKVQIYLPDMKYSDNALAKKYSNAPDYFDVCKAAIEEMFEQVGPCVFDDDTGLLISGVMIRHLILPGSIDNTFGVIDWVADNFSNGDVLFSLMSQYTPHGDVERFPELQRRLTRYEYDMCAAYLEAAGITDGYFQELSSAKEEFIPQFDVSPIHL